MSGRFPWPLVLPGAALASQAAAPFLVAGLAGAAHGRGAPPSLADGLETGLSLGLLAAAAASGLVLAGLGTYSLFRRWRASWAAPAAFVFCLPAAVSGSVYARALLIFLGLARTPGTRGCRSASVFRRGAGGMRP